MHYDKNMHSEYSVVHGPVYNLNPPKLDKIWGKVKPSTWKCEPIIAGIIETVFGTKDEDYIWPKSTGTNYSGGKIVGIKHNAGLVDLILEVEHECVWAESRCGRIGQFSDLLSTILQYRGVGMYEGVLCVLFVQHLSMEDNIIVPHPDFAKDYNSTCYIL